MNDKSSLHFFNVENIKKYNAVFNFLYGGRGTGKTYSCLSSRIDKLETKFILMRRTQSEIDLMCDAKGKEGVNPYKVINRDFKVDIFVKKINKNIGGFYKTTESGDLLIGYAVALSTIASVRGFDFSDVDEIIFDEFVPEKHVKKIKNEGTAFFNAYETVNRNRELFGESPVRCFFLANSNNIYNPIIVESGLIAKAEQMLRRGKNISVIKEKNALIYFLEDNGISDIKRETALYRLTKGTQYERMALGNEFVYNDFSLIEYQNLKNYRPLIGIGNITIYLAKDETKMYASYCKADCRYFELTEQDKYRYMEVAGRKGYQYFTRSKLFFENYDIKETLLSLYR